MKIEPIYRREYRGPFGGLRIFQIWENSSGVLREDIITWLETAAALRDPAIALPKGRVIHHNFLFARSRSKKAAITRRGRGPYTCLIRITDLDRLPGMNGLALMEATAGGDPSEGTIGLYPQTVSRQLARLLAIQTGHYGSHLSSSKFQEALRKVQFRAVKSTARSAQGLELERMLQVKSAADWNHAESNVRRVRCTAHTLRVAADRSAKIGASPDFVARTEKATALAREAEKLLNEASALSKGLSAEMQQRLVAQGVFSDA